MSYGVTSPGRSASNFSNNRSNVSAEGKIAVAGDSFRSGKATWTVEKVKGRRIETVRLKSDHAWPEEALVAAGLAHPSQDGRAEGAHDTSDMEEPTGHIS